MKIKLGITGIFAAIGLKVLGMPGAIMGFIAGLVTFGKWMGFNMNIIILKLEYNQYKYKSIHIFSILLIHF